MSSHHTAMRTYTRLRRRFTYADYEAAKRQWAANNPQATPEQYDQAMRKIAKEMGL